MPLVFSASFGLKGYAQKEFVLELTHELSVHHPGVFCFIPSPLVGLPHPLTRMAEILSDPVAEHSLRWEALNECTGDVIAALKAGKHVVVEDFGLDLHTSIMALVGAEHQEALRRNQDSNVERRVIGSGMPAPHYLLRRILGTSAVGEMLTTFPELHRYPRAVVAAFAERQHAAIESYCSKIAGQNPAVWLTGTDTDSMVADGLTHVCRIAGLQPPAQQILAAQ